MRKTKYTSFKWLLAAGVILSLIARLSLDFFGFEIWGSGVAAFICLGCLLIYYLSCRDRPFISSDLHAPENLYYMGLLFTLFYLMYSLISLFILGSGSDAEGRVYNLVGSFGISLLSTFAGILFRILLLQKTDHTQWPESAGPSQDPLEQQAHQDLMEASFHLRQELTQTITDMKIFRTTFSQANNETIQEHKKALSAMAQHIENVVSEQSKLLAEFEKKTRQNLTDAASQLHQELTQTIEGMKVFRTTFNQANNETIQEHKKAFSAMAQHAENAVSEQSKLLAEFEKKTHQNLTDAASQLHQELTQTVEDMKAFKLAFTKENSETVREYKKAFSDISQNVKNTVIEQTRLLAKLAATATDKLAASNGEAMESIKSVKESMDELAAQQAQKNKELIAAISAT